jgi:hypothetical protein
MRLAHLIAFFVAFTATASELAHKVDTGTHRSLFWYLNVHASEDHWIKIAGKKYHGVLGYGTTFIEIEKLNSIFFVTRRGHNRYAHFVSADGKIDCEVPFSGVANVGSSHGGVSVLSVNWPMVVIESRWSGFVDVFTFDLEKKEYSERRAKEPNQPSEPTAASGRGSS